MTREFRFSESVKLDLAQAAHFHCVRPGCNQTTHFYDSTTGKWRHFGAAAHDAPASVNEGGERSDNDLTPEQKKAYGNGAWLCRNCATLVDVAQSYFPLYTLPKWQADASEAMRQNAFNSVPPSHINYTEALAKAKNFFDLTTDIRFEGTKTDLAISVRSVEQINKLWRESWPLLPLRNYSGLFPHIVNLQNRMLDTLKSVKTEVTDLSNWHTNNGYYLCNGRVFGTPTEKAEKFRKSHAEVLQLIDDYFIARNELQQFIIGQVNHNLLYLW